LITAIYQITSFPVKNKTTTMSQKSGQQNTSSSRERVCDMQNVSLSSLANALANHRLNGSSSPVLTATSLSYGKAKNSTPHRIKPLIRLR